jgi:hypothetical protein
VNDWYSNRLFVKQAKKWLMISPLMERDSTYLCYNSRVIGSVSLCCMKPIENVTGIPVQILKNAGIKNLLNYVSNL